MLQLVHARSWQLTLAPRQADQALYALVLVALYGLILLLLAQLADVNGTPSWVTATLAPFEDAKVACHGIHEGWVPVQRVTIEERA